jgi:hypothetical protein
MRQNLEVYNITKKEMAVPKGFRSDININPSKIGTLKREELLADISKNGTFLPRPVSEEDMDEVFIDFVKSGLGITIDGEKVPVVFLTLQRWSEFTKTWKFTDKYKDIQLPFITVVRKPDIQVGTNQAGLWNIPGDRTYTYLKVPTWDGIRKGMDLYKIPQPTSVDITYEVRLFTNRMKDLNKLNTKVHKKFQSRQAYISVKGHPMPVHLETIGDESNVDDFESRKFYVQLFEMKLLGYIMDADDFEVIPTLNRIYAFIELDEEKIFDKAIFEPIIKGNSLTYTMVFKPNSELSFNFTAQYSLMFTQLINIENISRIVISVNGVGKFDGLVLTTPLTINSSDIVTIRIYKGNSTTGKFQLIGNTI